MNIIVTDGFALNPGDLSWKEIERLGDLIIYDRTPAAEVVDRCKYADIILTNKVPIDAAAMAEFKRLKLISVLATGYNIVDVKAAAAHDVVVCNIPTYGTDSVAQHVFALLLELTNHVGKNNQSARAGGWQTSQDFSYTLKPIHELADKTFGIVGFGNIGQRVAAIAHAFGMRVLYHNPSIRKSDIGTQVSLNDVFRHSDVVSLHCPLKEDNREFVNARLLKHMKPTALLINTARGQLINELDLAEALNNEVIGGAGLDVLSEEPPVKGNPLLSSKNSIITPHTAWISFEARRRIIAMTAANIEGFLKGEIGNRVN